MPYRICKTFEVESGHLLAKHPDKCRFPHGHTRQVEFVLEADDLDANEMVCDFKVVKDLIGEFLDRFDHSLCMNTADPKFAEFKAAYGDRIIAFEKEDPTTEVLARTIFDHFKMCLQEHARKTGEKYPIRPNVRVIKVRVWETSSTWSEYSERGEW